MESKLRSACHKITTSEKVSYLKGKLNVNKGESELKNFLYSMNQQGEFPHAIQKERRITQNELTASFLDIPPSLTGVNEANLDLKGIHQIHTNDSKL